MLRKLLAAIRQFITTLADPDVRARTFFPLAIRPVELASLLEKLHGLYDPVCPSRQRRGRAVIGSRVEVVDATNNSVIDITLTLPNESDPSNGLLSVLSPLGSALLDVEAGEVVDLFVGNRLTRLQVMDLDPN